MIPVSKALAVLAVSAAVPFASIGAPKVHNIVATESPRCEIEPGADRDHINRLIAQGDLDWAAEVVPWLSHPMRPELLARVEGVATGDVAPVIGWFDDYLERTLHVVVDTEVSSVADVRALLSDVEVGDLVVVLEPSCHSRSESEEVLRRLDGWEWGNAGRLVVIDPRVGGVLVRLPASETATADALSSEFGDLVVVQLAEDFGGLDVASTDQVGDVSVTDEVTDTSDSSAQSAPDDAGEALPPGGSWMPTAVSAAILGSTGVLLVIAGLALRKRKDP